MTIKIDMRETSQAVVYTEVVNAYSKGPFYYIYLNETVVRIPLANIS